MSSSDNPPAVILGGSWNAVSVARGLGTRAVVVSALADHSGRPVRFSRHCHRFVAVPPGEDPQAGWLRWLRERGPRGAVLLPCSDDALELVVRHRDELEQLDYRLIEANDEVVLAMLDKERTYELAREVGVPAPATVTVRSIEELERGAATIGFPCALKGLHSHRFARHLSGKAVIADGEDRLRAAFARTQELGIEVLLTEIVPGADDQYFSYYTYLDEHGEPLFHFTKQKLRQLPPGFGSGTYHITTWDPEVAELGLRFMQGVGMRGLGAVEFKRDARDGRLKLFELNHRLTAADEQLRVAGLDLALLMYTRVTGRTPPALDAYRRGVRLWYPLEDVAAALMSRSRGELTARDWLVGIMHRQTFPLLSREDPMPSLLYNTRLLARQVRKLVGRRGAPAAEPLASAGPDRAAAADAGVVRDGRAQARG